MRSRACSEDTHLLGQVQSALKRRRTGAFVSLYTFLVDRLAFEHYLNSRERAGAIAAEAAIGSAGSSLCGDVVRVGVELGKQGAVRSVRYEVEGCGATHAAAAACAELAEGQDLIAAALISVEKVSDQLGGLSDLKIHAAELAVDAFHRAVSGLWSTDQVEFPSRPSRVLVAMSGGVDSAVAALICKERGDETLAVTLKLWADPTTDGTKACCSPEAVVEARALAQRMGIPHFTLDLQEAFRAAVVSDYLSEHRAGRTPNPCVRCNGMVRFSAMLELARVLGAQKLVTGHYANVGEDDEGPLLSAAFDGNKDQAYMLAALEPELLKRLEFPLGEMSKPAVRKLAEEADLPVAHKSESQDLCFLAGSDRESFLGRHGDIGKRPGKILDLDGNYLGGHEGHHNFTVGQRKGLSLAAPRPLYVISTDSVSNEVVAGPRAALATKEIEIAPATLYRDGDRVNRIKLRYRQQPLECELVDTVGSGQHEHLAVRLNVPVDGVSPGQTACFMQADMVLGWGVIKTVIEPKSALESKKTAFEAANTQASLASSR